MRAIRICNLGALCSHTLARALVPTSPRDSHTSLLLRARAVGAARPLRFAFIPGSFVWMCKLCERGPLTVTPDDLKALLVELPLPRGLEEAEHEEERQRIELMADVHSKVSAATVTGQDSIIFSVDEIDEMLDCLPPPPTLATMRDRLADLRRRLLEGNVGSE